MEHLAPLRNRPWQKKCSQQNPAQQTPQTPPQPASLMDRGGFLAIRWPHLAMAKCQVNTVQDLRGVM